MAVLYFGGSFNPVHHGHLICARAAAEAGGFHRVVLVPSAQPPHKPRQSDMALPEMRRRMCELAVAGDPFFAVDALELVRTSLSYTLDTVRQLRAAGVAEVHWLIGADMLQILPQWHQAEQLLREVCFWIMARPGWSIDTLDLPPAFASLRQRLLPAPLIQISATDIRHRVREGKPIDYLVPPAVAAFIRDQGLYR